MSAPFEIDQAALDALMPMHFASNPSGQIERAGPLLTKIVAAPLVGAALFDAFEVQRPSGLTSLDRLAAAGPLRLVHKASGAQFKAQHVPVPGGRLFNLGFGIAAAEMVATHRLTLDDFTPVDATVEMLYLIEANSAVMSATRALNGRLFDAKTEAEAQASTDMLTGLSNRRAFSQALEAEIAEGRPFGLLHIDLDGYKGVNDGLGHAAGDLVLKTVAERLVETVRVDDTVARIGGDEFIILVPRSSDPQALAAVAQRVIEAIEMPVAYGEAECRISASAGVTLSASYRHPHAEAMLKDGDAALYRSKRQGGGRIHFA